MCPHGAYYSKKLRGEVLYKVKKLMAQLICVKI